MGRVSSGRVTERRRRSGPAPSTAAVSVTRGCICAQASPTSRTTSAVLKNTWATMIAPAVPVKRSSGSARAGSTWFTKPRGPSSACQAAATTRVGSTNGTSVMVRSRRLPGNR